jgi:hypothetical protein
MRAEPSVGKRITISVALLGMVGVLGASEVAEAHFVLQSPPAWMSQDSLGLPEKTGPCGDEYDGTDAATPTGIVTAVQAGQKITVTINEVIFHPGHYRIALATNRSALPADPAVTAGATPCGTSAIQSPPVFPVLADGVFVHTQPFTTPQSIEITLPSNITCSHCTLQVIEFMSDHALEIPNGCFYHHCADFSISGGSTSADAASPADAVSASGGSGGSGAGGASAGSGGSGGSGAADAAGAVGGGGSGTAGAKGGTSGPPASSSGCGLAAGPLRWSPLAILGIGAGALIARSRRRRAARATRLR